MSLDIHTRNVALGALSMTAVSEEELAQRLGNPEIHVVRRRDDGHLGPEVPHYLVRHTTYPINKSTMFDSIKLIDFGESFMDNDPPETIHTPLAVRAPEVIFGDELDHRVDLWSMGCMVSR
jgi:serine/threonine-protein kinase SRPK3